MDHAKRRLTPRSRWELVALGGLLGAVIGPTGFWLRGIEATMRLRERTGSVSGPPLRWSAAFRWIGTGPSQLGFVILAFIATAALMPVLLRWLEERAGRSAGAYYSQAAIAGTALGTGATVLTAMGIFLTLLVIGVANPEYTGTTAPAGASIVGMVVGATVFAPIIGVSTPFLYLQWILLFGVPFGLLFGVLVRRMGRTH